MPAPRGNYVLMHGFINCNHALNKVTHDSQTAVPFCINQELIMWYSEHQNMVETSAFASECIAMHTAVKLIKTLCYRLRMFGILVEGPTSKFCDSEVLFRNMTIPESTLKKKHNNIRYHCCQDAVAAGVMRVTKHEILTNLADFFTKPPLQTNITRVIGPFHVLKD